MSALERAITIAGGQLALADRLGVSLQAVNQWVHGGRITAERAVQIEVATGGQVKRHELRPDLLLQ